MAGATPEEAAQQVRHWRLLGSSMPLLLATHFPLETPACLQLIKTSAAFAKFLADAAAAYRSLVTRLQAAFGSVGVQLQVSCSAQPPIF